jgi:hypothetical protein
MCVQDGAGALYCGVHGLHPTGALPGRVGPPAGRPPQYCNYVCRMGLVPCIAVSTGYILLVLFLALLLFYMIMCVQDGAGACIAVSTGYILVVLFLAELARRLVALLNTVLCV